MPFRGNQLKAPVIGMQFRSPGGLRNSAHGRSLCFPNRLFHRTSGYFLQPFVRILPLWEGERFRRRLGLGPARRLVLALISKLKL